MLYSQVRECLKLDQDDKECFAHYKQVKKLSKQLDSAEELISEHRCVPCFQNHSNCAVEVSHNLCLRTVLCWSPDCHMQE